MMINCPKCNLLQPKDQYCAGCGINMESWKPPKKPFFKKLVSNWIFQLAILFIIVIVLVLRDSFFPPSNTKPTTPDLPSLEQEMAGSTDTNNFSDDPPRKKVVATRIQAKQKKFELTGKEKSSATLNTNAQPAPLKKYINAKIFLAARTQIENLLSRGQKVDEGVGYISAKDFNQFKQRWKRADSIKKPFEFNRPRVLFSGERSSENNKNIGFYFEITVFENNDNQNMSIELKSWNELKTNGGQEDAISYEFNFPRSQLVVISGIVSHDQVFTEDERALFESSSPLRVLNSENFIEDYSDILLVLELN